MKDRAFSLLVNGKDNPGLANSGYAKLLQYVTPQLMEAGWDTRLHCRVGAEFGVMEWPEPHTGKHLQIWSGGEGPYGESIIPAHLQRLFMESKKPPMVLFIGDAVALGPLADMARRREVVACAWTAVDWEAPTPRHAREKLDSFYRVWPMSQHGDNVLAADKLERRLPHVWLGVNPDIWKPRDRSELSHRMREMHFEEDTFNLFSCFANQWGRKSEREMLQAIGEFHKRRPEAKTRFFGLTQVRRDWDLAALTEHLGLNGIVNWSDDYKHIMGDYAEEDVAEMMNCADAVLSLGYEGFGLQTIEAQCLSKPVIGFNAGATPELMHGGMLVPPITDLMMAPMYLKPVIDREKLVDAIEWTYEHRNDRARWDAARRWVLNNATWKHSGDALVQRLESVEQAVADEELLGPGPPGPRGVELAKQEVIIE